MKGTQLEVREEVAQEVRIVEMARTLSQPSSLVFHWQSARVSLAVDCWKAHVWKHAASWQQSGQQVAPVDAQSCAIVELSERAWRVATSLRALRAAVPGA